MPNSIDLPDLDGKQIVSGLIKAAAFLGAYAAVDTFLYPDANLLPGPLEGLAGFIVAIGAGAFVLRTMK
ncbi:MAG: hypothetical protein AAGJ50_03765 [Pseudomonadota bacterium]